MGGNIYYALVHTIDGLAVDWKIQADRAPTIAPTWMHPSGTFRRYKFQGSFSGCKAWVKAFTFDSDYPGMRP